MTEEDVLSLLTLEKFQEWLLHIHTNDVVGVATNSRSCPIATYLLENDCELSGYGVEIGSIRVLFGPNDVQSFRVIPPEWVDKFIEEVDKMEGGDVTANDAFQIFKQITSNG